MAVREPIDLIIAKGKKHLTKAEIEARRAAEVQPHPEGIEAPAHLTKKQKEHFDLLAGQLQKIRIMGESDVETLARYVVAQEAYVKITKKVQAALNKFEDPYELDQLSKIQERYSNQAHKLATSLGMTVSSRCKLQVPVTEKEEKKNKFELLSLGGAKSG